jgi:hypothetical protein
MFLFLNYISTKLDTYVFYHVFRPLLSFSTMYLDLFFRFLPCIIYYTYICDLYSTDDVFFMVTVGTAAVFVIVVIVLVGV